MAFNALFAMRIVSLCVFVMHAVCAVATCSMCISLPLRDHDFNCVHCVRNRMNSMNRIDIEMI